MVYRFIDNYKKLFGVRWLLRKFSLSSNSYYNYLKNTKSKYQKQQQRIYEEIKYIYSNNNRIIGHRVRKIFLSRKGIHLSKTTMHQYRNRDLSLYAVVMRKKPAYVKGVKNKIFSNLLHQNFHIEERNKVWCTDFTYIRLANGSMHYNCTIIDFYDRCVIACVNSKHINTELAKETLSKAIAAEKPKKNVILHSDQGCQFTSWAFVDYCKSNKLCSYFTSILSFFILNSL